MSDGSWTGRGVDPAPRPEVDYASCPARWRRPQKTASREGPPTAGFRVDGRRPAANTAGAPPSAGSHLGWLRRQFRLVLRTRYRCRPVRVRRSARRPSGGADPGDGEHASRLARLLARRASGVALRLSGARTVRTRGGSSLQSGEALARSLCSGHRRSRRLERFALRLHDR